MTITLREIAEWVQGEVVGDGDTIIHGAKPINDAQKGDITFVESDRHYSSLHSSNASAAIVLPPSIANGKPLIKVQDPLKAFVIVVQKLANRPVRNFGGIHPSAQIHPSSTVGADACIGPFVSIGEGCVIGARCRLLAGVSIGHDCRLGEDVTLHPHVVLYDGCNIGDRVTIHANSVIGADGFGYRPSQGIHVKVPQLGNVEIAEDVEIGACSTIDRGTFGPTRIGKGTKIDNLVMIAHNCQIGRHNLLVAQVGIAGSCTTGDHVVMAGQVGVADHILVGDRVVVFAKSGITKDIESDEKVRGFPARSDKEQLRMMATLEKLPEIRRDIRQIKQQLHLDETTEHDLSVTE